MHEAITKLASSTAKRTLGRPFSLRPTKVPRMKSTTAASQHAQRSASEPSSVVTTKVHTSPSPVTDKGKGVTFEESEKETLQAGHLPLWLIPFAIASMGEAQLAMM